MTWILTSTGKAFDPVNPRADLISSVDIAHALANICRFNGHTHQHYSVAQHSLMVCNIIASQGHDTETQLQALLHDATEAYVCDLPRPLKRFLRDQSHSHSLGGQDAGWSDYDEIEHRVWLTICEHFKIDSGLPASIKQADMIALATERRDLMPDHPADWKCLAGLQALPDPIYPMAPGFARQAFHDRLMELVQLTHRQRAAVQLEHELVNGTSTGSPVGLMRHAQRGQA